MVCWNIENVLNYRKFLSFGEKVSIMAVAHKTSQGKTNNKKDNQNLIYHLRASSAWSLAIWVIDTLLLNLVVYTNNWCSSSKSCWNLTLILLLFTYWTSFHNIYDAYFVSTLHVYWIYSNCHSIVLYSNSSSVLILSHKTNHLRGSQEGC